MPLRRSAPALLAALCAASTIASDLTAQIITIAEKDQDGGQREVSRPAQIVDIGSTLTIRVRPDDLRAKALGLVIADSTLSLLIATLTSVAAVADSAVGAMKVAVDTWNGGPRDTAAVRALTAGLSGATSAAAELQGASALDPELDRQIASAVETAPPGIENVYAAVFEVAGRYAAELRNRRDSIIRSSAVYFQMGAWISSSDGQRPLHLDGFDEYPEGAPFDVDRFGIQAIALTRGQRDSLQHLADRARATRGEGLGGLFQTALGGARTAVAALLETARDRARSCGDIPVIAERLLSDRQLVGAVRQLVDTARTAVSSLQSAVGTLVARYRVPPLALDAGEWLASAHHDVQMLRDLALQTVAALGELPGASPLPGALAQAAGQVTAAAATCRTSLTQFANQTAASVRGTLASLRAADQVHGTVLAFADEVRRLDLDNVPSELAYPLRNAGVRTSGDRFLVRAALGRQGEQRSVTEEHELIMWRVLPHLRTSVGLIFADPLGPSLVQNRFQPVASYSILFKKGSRQSELANRLFLLGVGVNISAPDFDHDDTPEIGIGGVVSLLGDYLQAGVGYNVPKDRAYWFFGVRLPMPSLGKGGDSAEMR